MTPSGDAVADFNAMQGRLRISVTHACQLRCLFCHREGIEKHWAPYIIDPEFFGALVKAYASIGGRYVEITGGEPTLHPSLGSLLSQAAGTGCQVVLCTNGLCLGRIAREIRQGCIGLVRLSLHHGADSPERAGELLGAAWDFSRVEHNVELLRASDVPIQLIFTHTRENHDQLESLLRTALQWGVDVQVVDLISTRVGNPSATLGYVPGAVSERVVSQYAKLERTIADRTGTVLRLYRTSKGASWEVKNYHFGVLHSAMCIGCPVRSECGEGIYALRVDTLGVAKPCLLRADLEFKLSNGASVPALAISLRQSIFAMLASPWNWSYEDESES